MTSPLASTARHPAAAATSAPAAAAPSSVQVAAPVPPTPSIHVRAVITWIAIFPLVAIGMLAAAPLMEGWPPVLRALVLTLVVVPVAVYLVLPRLFAGYGFLLRRRNARRTTG
jgi:antibiotic biosynthesis monooxygenase (ABM) superfamily enzyme